MPTEHNESHSHLQQNLDALFNPMIRVVPEKDWSKIKAIWIPFLHHDAHNLLEKSEKITILQPETDKFGTVQGYLTAPNENYIPYITTFFNPAWTHEQVLERIIQAHNNILAVEHTVTNNSGEKIIRQTTIGVAKSGMMIAITTNEDYQIIDAAPIFHIDDNIESSRFKRTSQETIVSTPASNEQLITIKYNPIIKRYVATQPMSYDFYLLYALFMQSSCAPDPTKSYLGRGLADKESQNSTKSWIQFCKTSSTSSVATTQLFIHKNNGYIELFSMYDMIPTSDDLALPKAPKYIMTSKNFMNFMVQRSQIYKQRPDQFFIVIDAQGHAHLTTNLQTLHKVSFFGALQKRLASLFSRSAQ